MDNWKLEKAALQIAERLFEAGLSDLDEAPESYRAAAQKAYMDALGNDFEITFNVGEWVFGRDNGQSAQQFIDALIYAEAQRDLDPLIESAMRRIKRQARIDAAVDQAIDEMKLRRQA
jgi:hypothetical protein